LKTLIVGSLSRDVGEALSAVSDISGDRVGVVVSDSREEAEKASAFGLRVYHVNTRNMEAAYSALLGVYELEKPSLIVSVSTRNPRDLLSRLAGALDLPLVTGVRRIWVEDGKVAYERTLLSERSISLEESELPAVLLITPRLFKPAGAGSPGVVEEVSPGVEPRARIVEVRRKELGGARIEEAEIVVGVGRGFRRREDLELAFQLADLLGGAVGGSRPIAADLKWLPEDAWIGISGKRISPKLYLAIGISGAPQHMAGVSGSKIIVAVNKDKSAPIFRYADYGVVADLYEFLPVLIRKLRERGKA